MVLDLVLALVLGLGEDFRAEKPLRDESNEMNARFHIEERLGLRLEHVHAPRRELRLRLRFRFSHRLRFRFRLRWGEKVL